MLLDECGVTLEDSGVKFLKQIAETFVLNAVDSSYEISKTHKGDKIDARDLALHLSNQSTILYSRFLLLPLSIFFFFFFFFFL